MRLVSRLALSHALPVGLMAIALAVVLGALLQITSALKEVRDAELGMLHSEEAIHRAAWAVEVAMRHNAEACAKGRSSEEAARAIRWRLEELEQQLAGTGGAVRDTILGPVRDYQVLASRVTSSDTCKDLQSNATQRERERLDEQLTNAWISRMFELHSALRVKDEEARRAGSSAFSGGIVLALVACAAAALLANRIGRTVTRPLASLAENVRRVGKGDFTEPIPNQHGPLEVRELSEEIEAMRRRLAELDTLKQGFLASVSHEMRTPLTKIREALALLSDGAGGSLTERQERIVQIAQVACEREIRTVTTLLDLSRLRAGAPLKRHEGALVDEVVRSAARDEEPEARERGVTIDVEMQGEAPTASLDTALVACAVANVLRNAVAVSKKGQRVQVRRTNEARGPDGRAGSFVRIDVKDEGPGIPPDVREVLFDAFVTHSVANSPKRVGIGLGLALAREIARAHGGDIDFGEESKGGAVFRIWLACDAIAPQARALPSKAPEFSAS